MKNVTDPFYAFTVRINGVPTAMRYTDAESRLARVKEFDASTCERALQIPNLQKTVRAAIERRLRRLAKVAS